MNKYHIGTPYGEFTIECDGYVVDDDYLWFFIKIEESVFYIAMYKNFNYLKFACKSE